jgi:phospholipid/cholesterol/gamma-HCH transport system ATP-binding protein
MRRKPIQNMQLENVSFGWDSGAPLFENISFDIPTDRAVWLRSPGGRGKSTMMRLLAGLIPPTAGRYLINGENIADMSFEEALPFRLNMGYGFDMGGLLNNKTVFENLILPLQYHKLTDMEDATERVNSAIDMFGMTTSRDLRPYAIPGSQRKLTCIIRAFMHWPQVVFLDDPMTGLKEDNLNDLYYFVEESFASRGLKQMFFTSESPVFANHFKAAELLISPDWFTTRKVA